MPPVDNFHLFHASLTQLHHTLSELEFNRNPQGLSTEYKSLHDKHLKNHYRHPITFSRLIQNGFITPEGMVRPGGGGIPIHKVTHKAQCFRPYFSASLSPAR